MTGRHCTANGRNKELASLLRVLERKQAFRVQTSDNTMHQGQFSHCPHTKRSNQMKLHTQREIMAPKEIIPFLATFVLLLHSRNPAAAVSGTTTDQDQFVFSGFTGANLTLDGTATVTADGLLELTNGTVQLKGHAFHPVPVRFRRTSLPDGGDGAVRSFSASFAFAILTTYLGLSCHDVAFAVTPSKDFSSALAVQYMGIANIDDNGNATNSFFAAEIDTMQNVEFQDIDNNHVGIDVNGLRYVEAHARGTTTMSRGESRMCGEGGSFLLPPPSFPPFLLLPPLFLLPLLIHGSNLLGGLREAPMEFLGVGGLEPPSSHAGFAPDAAANGSFHVMNLISGEVMLAWVDYNGEATRINVIIAPIGVAKPVRPLISATYNLSDVLREPSYIGFSSATGPINSHHYILGWSFAMDGFAPTIDIAKLPKLPRLSLKPPSKVLEKFLVPIATTVFIVTLGTLVVMVVRRRMRYVELWKDWEVDFGPHRFSYKDLFHATDGCEDKHLLRKGGFGRVYRGVLSKSKVEVAVKRVSHVLGYPSTWRMIWSPAKQVNSPQVQVLVHH